MRIKTNGIRQLLAVSIFFAVLGVSVLVPPRDLIAQGGDSTVYLPLLMTASPPLSSLQLAFLSDRDEYHQMYIMQADGDGVTQLTDTPWYKSRLDWSPDGAWIAFGANPDTPTMNWDIYVMQRDGSGLVNLTDNPAGDGNAAWSPDGSLIAFESDRDGNSEIYVMNGDGSDQRNLTNHPASDEGATWSPDGAQIAFISNRTGTPGLYVMEADGMNPTYLADASRSSRPAWSPDGQSIAYVFDSNIFVLSLNTLIPAKLTDYASNLMSVTGAPVWSPDGVELAFSHCDCYFPSAAAIVNLIRADGSDGAPRVIDQGYDPIWSPDGGYLVYGARHGAMPWTTQIHVWVKQTGQSLQLTTDADGSNGAARWRPSVAKTTP